MHHGTKLVRQPVIPSLVTIRQSFMIDSQLMQNRCIQIMNVDGP